VGVVFPLHDRPLRAAEGGPLLVPSELVDGGSQAEKTAATFLCSPSEKG